MKNAMSIVASSVVCCMLSCQGVSMHDESRGPWNFIASGYDKVTQTVSHAYESAREWVSPDVSFADEIKKQSPFMGKTLFEIRAWFAKALQHMVDMRMANQTDEMLVCAKRLNERYYSLPA